MSNPESQTKSQFQIFSLRIGKGTHQFAPGRPLVIIKATSQRFALVFSRLYCKIAGSRQIGLCASPLSPFASSFLSLLLRKHGGCGCARRVPLIVGKQYE